MVSTDLVPDRGGWRASPAAAPPADPAGHLGRAGAIGDGRPALRHGRAVAGAPAHRLREAHGSGLARRVGAQRSRWVPRRWAHHPLQAAASHDPAGPGERRLRRRRPGDLPARLAIGPAALRYRRHPQLARIAGPGSAGLLLLLIPEIDLFTVDAATFLVSAAALLVVARGLRAAAPDPAGPVQQPTRLLDGIREVLSRPALRVGLAVRGSCNLAWSAFTIGLPFELAHRLHAGLASYGLVLGAFGLGNLIGNLLSGSRRVGGHLMVVYCLSWSLAGTGLLGLAAAPSLALAVLATVWMGIFTPVANVSMDTYIARVIPADRLARFYALQRVTVAAASALGVFAVAAGINATSGPAVIAMAGAWMLLAGLIALIRIGRAAKRPHHRLPSRWRASAPWPGATGHRR